MKRWIVNQYNIFLEHERLTKERLRESKKEATTAQNIIHAISEKWHARALVYLGIVIINCWFFGHLTAFLLYTTLDLDYFRLASLDNGLTYSFENSLLLLMSLAAGMFIYLMLSLVFSCVVNFIEFTSEWYRCEKLSKARSWYNYARYVANQGVFILTLTIFDVFLFVSVVEKGDVLGINKSIKYLVELNGEPESCYSLVGKLGEYQVFLGGDGKGKLVTVEATSYLKRCVVD